MAASPSSRCLALMSLMSAPETNDDSPAPVMMSTPTSASAAELDERGTELPHGFEVERVLDRRPVDHNCGNTFLD